MLMGVGGSGRKTCCKLSASIINFQLVDIEINKDYKVGKNWKDDIKKCLLKSGIENIQTVLFL